VSESKSGTKNNGLADEIVVTEEMIESVKNFLYFDYDKGWNDYDVAKSICRRVLSFRDRSTCGKSARLPQYLS